MRERGIMPNVISFSKNTMSICPYFVRTSTVPRTRDRPFVRPSDRPSLRPTVHPTIRPIVEASDHPTVHWYMDISMDSHG